MAKSKNHTTHNQSQKWHRNESLKAIDLKFLRSMHFAKKHKKKGLKKMQSNNAKAIKAQTEAIKALNTKASKAKLLRPKISKANAQCAGQKMATKRPGPRVDIKHPGSKITKPDAKVARTTDPKNANPTDPKAAKPTDPKAAKPTSPKKTTERLSLAEATQ
uniref:60S ribosomal protein L29 n=1 Tax=Monodelphis domestica TaxID=13616 RepID=A0A5F8GPA9_MONDO